MVDRYGNVAPIPAPLASTDQATRLLLLPGSRASELSRHLPVLAAAWEILRRESPELRARMIVPSARLLEAVRRSGLPAEVEVQCGGLAQALADTDLAIACTGTVTLECAYFGVPTVALYKTSWITYQIARRIVTVQYLAMPNLLAKEAIFPEFVQDAATGENIARATRDLLRDPARRARISSRLSEIRHSLGGPGASRRAAGAILRLMRESPRSLSPPPQSAGYPDPGI